MVQSIFLPSVAVCLAAFNGKSWLPEQLDSILMQTDVILTVYVCVDLSVDGTDDWIDLAAKKDARVIVLQHGMRFGGAARNFFHIIKNVNFSNHDFIALADQDDIWLPDKLSRAYKMLSKMGADAYSSNVIAFWPDGRKVLIKKSQKQVRWDFLFEAAGPGCTYVLRKELVFAIQGLLRSRWDEVQRVGLHDWFFYAFARANNYRWVIDDYPGMLYRQHKKNQVGVNVGWQAYRHRARTILNGWGLNQSALIAELVGIGNDAFVGRWSGGRRVGLLFLALHAWQCRRRLRDKLLFALSCIAVFVVGNRYP